MAKLLTGLAILDAPAYEIRSLDGYRRELEQIHLNALQGIGAKRQQGARFELEKAKASRAIDLLEQLDDHLREQGD